MIIDHYEKISLFTNSNFAIADVCFAQNNTSWPSSGNVWIGTLTPASGVSLHVVGSPEQLRLGYNATNYASFNVNSVGQLLITPTYTTNSVGLIIPTGIATNVDPNNANLSVLSSTGAGSTSASAFLLPGVSNLTYRVGIHGSGDATVNANNSYSSFVIATESAKKSAIGTHYLFAQQIIRPLNVTGTGVLNNSASLYIEGDSTGATNNYALWSASGLNYFGGQVAIGTPTMPTGHQLAVNGSTIATAIVVKPNCTWPDYVFKKDYKLPSLTTVAKYIAKHQHLSGLSTAEDVAKDGLDLGEINKNLTKKVEELTLYLIEQQKINRSLQKQIEHIARKINK